MNKLDVYKFLNELTEVYSGEPSDVLKDIIVDYLLFPQGDGESPPSGPMSELDQEIARLMPEAKIMAVKLVREKTGMSLVESKEYIENRIWPNTSSKGGKAFEMQQQYVSGVIAKIRKDYKMKDKT